MKIMKYKWVIITWLLLAATMVMIFAFSAQNVKVSDGLSRTVTEKVLKFYYYLTENIDFSFEFEEPSFETSSFFEDMNHYVRKLAHITEFAMLGFFMILHIFSIACMKRYPIKRLWIPGSLAFCALYAVTDEFHQFFVDGRGPMVKDVMIDSAGSVIGIMIGFLLVKMLKKKGELTENCLYK